MSCVGCQAPLPDSSKPTKYCSKACGIAVARLRLSYLTKTASESSSNEATEPDESRMHPIDKADLASLDREFTFFSSQLASARALSSYFDAYVSSLPSPSSSSSSSNLCLFDTRWPNVPVSNESPPVISEKDIEMFGCKQSAKTCQKHASWKKLKRFEIEVDLNNAVFALESIENDRKAVKERVQQRQSDSKSFKIGNRTLYVHKASKNRLYAGI